MNYRHQTIHLIQGRHTLSVGVDHGAQRIQYLGMVDGLVRVCSPTREGAVAGLLRRLAAERCADETHGAGCTY